MQAHGAFFDAKLLLAEDNPVNQDIATRVLEHMGCRIVTAENGAVAERLLAQEKFDLVLMDCEMPELDGFEATRRFRLSEAAGSARIPVIALTAHVADDIRQKCLDAGMDDLLAKPFKKAQISETLRRWIGNLERTANPEEQATAEQGSISAAPAQSMGVGMVVAGAADNAPIDRAILDDFLDSKGEAGRAVLRRLLLRFSETAPVTVASMREKYQAQLPEDLWRIAHGLRSSAAALGVRHVSRRLADVEKSAREHGLDGLEPLLTALELDFAIALESLQSLIGELNARPH